VDRTWSDREFNLFTAKAMELSREDYAAIFHLARYAGLRLHECFRIDTQIAAKAIKTEIITIRGKNGLVRAVPSHPAIDAGLKTMLAVTPRGHKLFVAPDEKTHHAMKRFEEFIRYYKPEIQDTGSMRPLHFHGLRHRYAAETYRRFIAEGCGDKEARRRVSELLGHRRSEITQVYLASLEENKEISPAP
jgi:integrase